MMATLRSTPKEAGCVHLWLEGGRAVTSREDLQLLHALLRLMRTCPVLIVIVVPASAPSIGLLDLVLLLLADVAFTENDSDHDSRIITFSSAQPALEAYVDSLWERAVGPARAGSLNRPSTLASLRASGILRDTIEINVATAERMHPSCLLGLRRLGRLRMHKCDKMSFNYYWVTKVMSLNAHVQERRATGIEIQVQSSQVGSSRCTSSEEACRQTHKAPHLWFRTRINDSTLYLTIYPSIVEVDSALVHATLASWPTPHVARIMVTLAPVSEEPTNGVSIESLCT